MSTEKFSLPNTFLKMSCAFMNDTLDNFHFTQNNLPKIIFSPQKSSESSLNNVAKVDSGIDCAQDEISFDDSLFLSESLEGTDVTEEKETRSTRQSDIPENREGLVWRGVILKEQNSTRMPKDSTAGNKCAKNKAHQEEIVGHVCVNNLIENQGPETDSKIKKLCLTDTEEGKRFDNADIDKSALSSWGLPQSVVEQYESKNLKRMFPWQVECLSCPDVLNNCKNLVYSAPTSAGKTLVGEVLAIKTIFDRQKKAIIILPFVSIVREKMYYLQDLLGNSGIRVEGFMGSYNPPGGFSSVQVAICTIEKANNLVNRLMEEGKLSDIGAVLVDEMHLLGDPSRGYLLELLLTKLLYMSRKDESIKLQIIGMSATLPNLSILATWLDAELYVTDFRPVPLHEQAAVCGEIYDKNLKLSRKLSPLPELENDTDSILQLCLETIKDCCSVLIFCPTKNWCENLALQISTAFFKIGSKQTNWGQLLRLQLNTSLIMELLEQLKFCPVGLDEILRKTASFGVAFHHAGLTMDERDIIEGAFRNGALRILVATSTLSSGVNLPARRVIIRTPIFNREPIGVLIYRQMIGRAGRMGRDSVGESFLVCQKNDYRIAKELMTAELTPIESCLQGAGKLKRAILEVVASGVASTPEDVDLFTNCTLLAVEDRKTDDLGDPVGQAVTFLTDNEFVRLQKMEDGSERYVATSLGKACLSSSIAPDEGLSLFSELEKARQCLVLETELHLIYLVTPYSACHQWGNIDWMFYLDVWEKLPASMKKVGELVGVREAYIVNATRGKISTSNSKLHHKLLVHKRFFVALALQDLVNEKPLAWVCSKFTCNRGMLQSLQQSASTFAGMVTAFSRQLGWGSVELLISQFQDRLQFGVARDLLDLMRIPTLNGKMARTLYNAGVETVAQLANSTVPEIENVMHRVIPFESEKEREGESEFDKRQRNKYRNVWVSGKEGLTEREAAEMLVAEARRHLKLEMGLVDAKWESSLEGGSLNGAKDSVEHEQGIINNCGSKSRDTKEPVEQSKAAETTNVSDSGTTDVELKHDKNSHSIATNRKSEDIFNNSSSSTSSDCENEKTNLGENYLSVSHGSVDTGLEESLQNQLRIAEHDSSKVTDMSDLPPSLSSDESLFDESFTLQLDKSDSFTKNSDKVIESNFEKDLADFTHTSFLENTFAGTFSENLAAGSDDVLISSFEESVCSSKKRNPSLELKTPNKKFKMCKTESDHSDLAEIDVVDVCAHVSLFETFHKEVKLQKNIAVSLGCSRIEIKPVLGDQQNNFCSKNTKLHGFAVSWGNNTAYYLSLENTYIAERVINLLKILLKNKSIRVKMCGAKKQIVTLKNCWDINFNAQIADPKVADWLLEPEGKEKNLQAMAVLYCPNLVQSTGFSKGAGSAVDPKIRSCTEAVVTWHLVESLELTLFEVNPAYLDIYEVENATLVCLAKIELAGMSVRQGLLKKLTDDLKIQLEAIEKKAFSLAGRRFNFASSRDVAKVTGLFRGKRVSTRKQILQQNTHPISDLVLHWRKINCTLTKMIYPLIRTTANDRIHGCYVTHTSTGRISMHDPNLQNVTKDFSVVNPLTMEDVNISCRSAFVAPDDHCLVSADYCQLELRVLTHLSGDELLGNILRQPGDVFRSIAAKWNNVEEDLVTDSMRQNTKHLCYGIIYGMGGRSLAEQLQITETEAVVFMETFRNTYPGVRAFVRDTIDRCRKNGYIQTLTGRRRYLPCITEVEATKKGHAERQAVNTVVQGSAADIAKRAMIQVENDLREIFCKAKNRPKLVLHLHDELIYEVPSKYVRKVAKIIKKNMEESVKLSVPFPVKIKTGQSWGGMTEYAL